MVESKRIPDQIKEIRKVVNLKKDNNGGFVMKERTLTTLPNRAGVYELPSETGPITVDMSLQKIRTDQDPKNRHVTITGEGIGDKVSIPLNLEGEGVLKEQDREIVVYTRDLTSELKIVLPLPKRTTPKVRGW